MPSRQISPRVILGIIVILIGLLMLWKSWNGRLTDSAILTGIALIIIGSQLTWCEVDHDD